MNPILRLITCFFLLTLPLTANAVMLKATRPSHSQFDAMHYGSSSSKKAMSTSSAPSLVIIRSPDTGMVFSMPDTWKALYDRNGVAFRLDRGNVSPYHTSFLSVTKKKLSKPITLKLLYKTILDKATVDSGGTNLSPDFYIPSFQLTGSGTVKTQGTDALSLSYTGEQWSETRTYKRLDFMKAGWQYTIWLSTFPQYAKEDGKVWDGVVGSLNIDAGSSTKTW